MTDQDFLAKAIEVGNQMPQPYNFGAVVVKDNKIISVEYNHVHETNDLSLHSEATTLMALYFMRVTNPAQCALHVLYGLTL